MRWLARLSPLLLFVPVVVALGQWVPDRIETPFVAPGTQGMSLGVLLPGREFSRGLKDAYAIIQIPDPAVLTLAQSIVVVVGTNDRPADLVDATAILRGTNCTFVSAPNARLINNGPLVLFRARACGELQGTPTGDLDLRISYKGESGLNLWITLPDPDPGPGSPRMTVPPIQFSSATPIVHGGVVNEYRSVYRRVELLAYMWRGTTGSGWLWAALGATFLAMAWAVRSATIAPVTPLQTAVVALVLGSVYALLVPPFQAPDEPSHFLTFAEVTHQPALVEQAEALARRTHFERIRFNPDQRFRTADLNQPLDARWSSVSSQDPLRSRAALWLWQLVSWLLPSMSAWAWLLALRLVDALLLAAAVGAVAHASRPATGDGVNLALPLLLVPTLPFFGMHVSNHALLTCADVLIAGAAVVGLWRPERRVAAAVLLVIGQALAIASGRIGTGVLPLTVAIALGLLIVNRAGGLKREMGGTRVLAFAAAGICILLLAGSMVLQYPAMTPAASMAPGSVGAYAVRALEVVATFPRLDGSDLLLSDSFWGGFGWLDTYPSPLLPPLMGGLTAVMLAALFVSIGRRHAGRQAAWMVLLAFGFFGAVAALAAGSYLYSPDLHGRYLLGVYLPAFAIAWSPVAAADTRYRAGRLIVPCAALLHGACLGAILQRYF